MAQDGTSGVSGTRDGAGDAGRPAAPADATGDLQFDEAWQDAAAEGDARPDRAHDGPGPVFEDPNDR